MATSNACKPTLASSQIEKISGEKSCSFSQRFVNTRSACDLLVQWPESPESARQPLRRALARLENKGYVVYPVRRVVEGAVKEVELWEINWSSPAWRSVESDVRGTVLPARVAADHASSFPPKYLDHLFWNVDRSSLNLDSDGAFIALRVLGSLDLQGLSWLASGAISKENLRRASRARGISPRQKDFALNLARQM